MKRWIPLFPLILMAGCTLGPDYVRPTVEEPVDYRTTAAADTTIADLPWWEMFQDPVLQDLIESALEGNRDLRASMARISEARARLGIVRADLYPRLNYAADGGLDRSSASDGTSSSAVVALDVSYQVDL